MDLELRNGKDIIAEFYSNKEILLFLGNKKTDSRVMEIVGFRCRSTQP